MGKGTGKEANEVFNEFPSCGGGLGSKMPKCNEGGERSTQTRAADAGARKGGTSIPAEIARQWSGE